MSVLDLVAREARRTAGFARMAGAALPVVVAVALLTGGAMWLARGRWMALPRAVPFVVWLGALALGAWIAVRARRRLGARSSPAAVALAIEDEQQLRRGALTGLLEVAPQGGPFVAKAANALGAKLASVEERPAPRHRRRLRAAAVLSFVALLQVLTLASTSFAKRADGWRALLNPVDAWRGTLLPALAIDELPRRLPRGAQAAIGIAAAGRTSVTLRWRPTGAGWRDTLLVVSPEGRASITLNAVDADLALLADDGRTVSDTAHVRVVDRPFVGDVTIRATYPAYLGRAPERLAADAPIRIPAGTRLDIDGHSSAPLEAVALRAGTTNVPLRADGMTFGGRMVPATSATWSWEARGLRQEIADLPAPLEIDVIADSVPHVEILAPVGEVLVGPQGRVMLDLFAQDDHSVTGVWLRRWVVDQQGVVGAPTVVRLSEERVSEWVGGATEELAPLKLEPGMQVRIQAFARDGAPGSDREGTSATLVLRIPTTDEERRAARAAGDAAVEAALATARAQAKLGEQTETAARSRSDRATEGQKAGEGQKDPKAMGYENAEQAKEIAERQKELQERVAGLEEAARDMEDRLRRAGALDTALARQLQDAQKMLREAMTPEMLEAMQKLESSSQQLDGDRTRQSLQEMAQQQQKLRETLEKSAQMLKRAALEGSMQTLADEAKELAGEQRQFADSAAGTSPDTSRASELSGKTQDLAKAMEKLRERLEQERAQTGADEAAKAEASAERSEALLKEAQARARDANRPMQGQAQRQQAQAQARDAAQQAAQSMEQAAEQMEKARSGQVSEWKGELNNALDQTVQEMLQLAKEQEELAAQAQRDPNDPQLRQQQSALQQGVQTAQQRLQKEGQKSALVSPRTEQMMEQAKQQVQQATRESAEGQQRGGQQKAQAMQEAANSLRQAAAQLTRDRERSANSESASGLPEMLQQLQQLAQQQGSLNGQMQSLMPTQQQGQPRQGLDAAGRQQARELAKSQREVARALDEVADSDPTGRAQEMAREARMLAQALDQGAVDPATQARQERLFRRMLDAGRSLENEQKDESQRRESRAARGTERFTPPGGPARGRDAARYTVPTWEELRGLSAEERRLVIEYFRRLNAEAKP
jgi:hypothetical protein